MPPSSCEQRFRAALLWKPYVRLRRGRLLGAAVFAAILLAGGSRCGVLLRAQDAPAPAGASAVAADADLRLADNPFAAHNAYPWRLYGPDRFDRALAAGLKHLEVDVTYDPQRQAVVATHDSRPAGNEPELGQLLAPLWEQWGGADEDGYTLIIDFKSSSPELAAATLRVLEPHRGLLSTLRKSASPQDADTVSADTVSADTVSADTVSADTVSADTKSADTVSAATAADTFRPGKITVCLTGSGRCHEEFDRLVAAGDEYLAFADFGHSTWRDDPAGYVPDEPPAFHRFLTFEYGVFMESPGQRGAEHFSTERLAQVVELANARGYRLRVYTINPARSRDGLRDELWRACVEAGAHMISTDAYELARDWWREHVTSAAPQ